MKTHLSVCVAIATRQRPRMLRAALQSLEGMAAPEYADVTILVVENDTIEHSASVIAECKCSRYRLSYELEPRLGIPYARNRAIDYVLTNGIDLLAFIDDDERASVHWLSNLLETYRQTGCLLIGGPVLALPVEAPTSQIESHLLEALIARCEHRARRAEEKYRVSKFHQVTIVTNNWLGHRDLFQRYGLRFDEQHALTGGSDTHFDMEVKRLGLPRAWSAPAIVHEEIPSSRLTASYQFRRAKDQSAVSFSRKCKSEPLQAMIGLPFAVVLRVASLFLTAATLPFRRGTALLTLLRSSGWIAGRVSAAFGYQSRLYERVTGE